MIVQMATPLAFQLLHILISIRILLSDLIGVWPRGDFNLYFLQLLVMVSIFSCAHLPYSYPLW